MDRNFYPIDLVACACQLLLLFQGDCERYGDFNRHYRIMLLLAQQSPNFLPKRLVIVGTAIGNGRGL